MKVLYKAQNYRLWQGGAFGNKLRSWRTVDEWRASGFRGLVTVRALGTTGDGICVYDIPTSEVEACLRGWQAQGIDIDRVTFDEAAPCAYAVVQGYLWNGAEAYNQFYFSRAFNLHMRDALALEPEYSFGLATDVLLKRVMTPSSWSDLEAIKEFYPDHTIELSVYRVNLGDIPGRNTLVWEVRRY